MRTLAFDTEVYQNYHLLLFKDLDSKKVFEIDSIGQFLQLAKDSLLVTFNGNSYDIPLLRYWLAGASEAEIKEASNNIIMGRITPYRFFQMYNCDNKITIHHIDLIEVCPGKGGLKLYGARFGADEIRELPYEHNKVLDDEEKRQVKKYCQNDLDLVELIWHKLEQPINLRRAMSNAYKMDLRSKSDAQIAEAIISSKLGKVTASTVTSQEFIYQCPDYISFKSLELNKLLHELETVSFVATNTEIIPPKALLEKYQIGQIAYQTGKGGLHSTEKNCFHKIDQSYMLIDFDVASYYPRIILNLGLYPKRIGKRFLDTYNEFVTERLAAKISGDKSKADSLKLVINGSFGKFGSVYSTLYAPDLLVQVTVTGQLALLMLIETIEEQGIQVLSANTDGIVCKVKYSEEKNLLSIISNWEQITGFEMERTDYQALYSKDVNNYIAVTLNNEIKAKGCFGSASFQKNPQSEICNDAIVEYLVNETPIEETIRECSDIRKFLTVRTVNGGAVKDKEFVGKIVRYYYSTKTNTPINYVTNNNMVPMTIGAKPLMKLPKFLPLDIDYNRYIEEAEKLLSLFTPQEKQQKVQRQLKEKRIQEVKEKRMNKAQRMGNVYLEL